MDFLKTLQNFWHYSYFLKTKTAKFGMKLGVVAGATYLIAEQGLWRDSNSTSKLYNKIKTNTAPYTEEICKQIPIEFPSLPNTGEVSYLARHYWNRGVIATFNFIANVPSYISEYSEKGVNAIMDSNEVKKLLSLENDTKK